MHAPKILRFVGPVLVALAACAPARDRSSPKVLEQGRIYTNWLYGKEYGKLYDRLAPEMRQVFGSAAELGAFAGRAVGTLGQERKVADERVVDEKHDKVYTRTASFAGARKPMMIEWSLTPSGAVNGLLVKPAEESKD